MSMSFSHQKINLNNLNELEEGEISDSNLNKQDILNLIENKKILSGKRSPKVPTENRIFPSSQSESSRPNVSDDEDEEVEVITMRNKKNKQDSEDEEETGFFHKMFKKEKEGEKISRKSEGFLKVKRKSSKEIEQDNVHKKQFKKIEKKPKEVEYQVKPEYEPKSKKDKKKQDFKPRLICQYWVNGACNKGKDCTFSHDAPQVKKQEMCKYFLSGTCMKREDCLYSHDITALPCKFFHAIGCCMNGESCKFSHNRLNEDEIFKFIEQNEEFILHLYKTMGRTNMDDFLQKYLQDKGKLQGDLKSSYGDKGNLGSSLSAGNLTNSSHNIGSLPPSSVMLPQSMQHASKQEQGLKNQGSLPLNIPNILHSKLITQLKIPIPNMNLNLLNPIVSQNQPGFPQPQIPQHMNAPRMDGSLNVRPSQPIPMLNQPQINALIQSNPSLYMNFMRNPNSFQGMIQLQPPNIPNLSGVLPLHTNNIQNEEIIFNDSNNNQKVQRSLDVKNVISQVNPFQRPQINVQNENSTQIMQSKVDFNKPLQQITQNQIINKTREIINLNESESEKEEMSFFLKSLKGFQPQSDQINLFLPSHFETGNPSNMTQSQSNLNELSFNNISVSISEPSEKLSRDPRKKFKRKLK